MTKKRSLQQTTANHQIWSFWASYKQLFWKINMQGIRIWFHCYHFQFHKVGARSNLNNLHQIWQQPPSIRWQWLKSIFALDCVGAITCIWITNVANRCKSTDWKWFIRMGKNYFHQIMPSPSWAVRIRVVWGERAWSKSTFREVLSSSVESLAKSSLEEILTRKWKVWLSRWTGDTQLYFATS